MANLVRYCLHLGKHVAGYDRTTTPLTKALESEGAHLVYTDDASLVPMEFRDPDKTLVVYTPAVGDDNSILSMFRREGFEIVKRARLLGELTRGSRAVCVAGSHGKTTVSSMTANILRESRQGCNAFLGGILRNTGSNLLLHPGSDINVVEADEYDRSFHQLSPYLAVVTSTDPDHLDIYGDEAHYLEAFSKFTSLIVHGGKLIMHTGLKFRPDTGEDVSVETYSADDPTADWHAEDVTFSPGRLSFTLRGPRGIEIKDIALGVPVKINVDNAVAASAAALSLGADAEEVRKGLESFMGAKRRFEIWMPGRRVKEAQGGAERVEGPVLIDDYAHSPNEVRASIESVRRLYPGMKLSVIFQPHLYSRTRDFAPDFASALSGADEVIMPEIYPAREAPIEGVDSQLILRGVTSPEKRYCERKDLLNLIKNRNFEILMTLGAADIDLLLPEIKKILERDRD